MTERRITTDKRPEPSRVHAILAQMRDLSYKDFVRLAEIFDFEPSELMQAVEDGIEKEKKAERIASVISQRSAA